MNWRAKPPNRGRPRSEAPEKWERIPNRGRSPRLSGGGVWGGGSVSPPDIFKKIHTWNRAIWCMFDSASTRTISAVVAILPRLRLGGLEECRNLQLPHRVLACSLSHQHPIFITLQPNSVQCSSVLFSNFNRGLVRSARGRNSIGV